MQCILARSVALPSMADDGSALHITMSSSGLHLIQSHSQLLFPTWVRDEGCRQKVLLQDMHQEIQDVLGQNFGIPDDIDEDELMEELDALEDDLTADTEANADGVPSYLQVVTQALLCNCLHGWVE